uniref:Uncharacterized protein n=1 Tax=Caulobacter sp. (strain K31) TaxID=366602 RepID=B0T9G5_CAUSK
MGARSGLARALAASGRLRRLALVLGLTPGMVIVLLLAPVLRNPILMVLGLVLLAAVLAASRALEAWATRLSAAVGAPAPPLAPPSETV